MHDVKAEISRTKAENLQIWLFAYGSLIFKPNFHYAKRITGYIKGYKRRFWQRSTDHRGTPGAPGRVVTLIPDEKENTIGVAYCIQPKFEEEKIKILSDLDHREKGGYTRHYVEVYDVKTHELLVKDCLLYVGTEDNPEYQGYEPIDVIAEIIAFSEGPSGKNCDYLFNLANSLRMLNVYDPHVFTLEEKVRDVIKKQKITNKEIIEEKIKYYKKTHQNTVNHTLGIDVFLLTPKLVRGRMVVTSKHGQPFGVLHGGVNVVLAESLASMGSWLHVDAEKYNVFGMEINCNHIRPVPVDQGIAIIGNARPVHVGRTSQVWQIDIIREDTEKLVATSRITIAVVPKDKNQRSKL